MYVYSDIVELSLVNNTQVPIIGILPIKPKFQEAGHWVFNLPLYVRVKKKSIYTITIKVCAKTCEKFPIQDGVVTCRFHFRSRPCLA